MVHDHSLVLKIRQFGWLRRRQGFARDPLEQQFPRGALRYVELRSVKRYLDCRDGAMVAGASVRVYRRGNLVTLALHRCRIEQSDRGDTCAALSEWQRQEIEGFGNGASVAEFNNSGPAAVASSRRHAAWDSR